MGWKVTSWECGGLLAERDDGERFYLYRRLGPPEGYIVRWRGRSAGEILRVSYGSPGRASWLLDKGARVSELDLMEVVRAMGRG
ncbi:MAG TPA: hypothetical protein PK523_11645 [Elusimicrobiales bacterium]|nr:hypothetical protein [Elusimicrobiales bacterium]